MYQPVLELLRDKNKWTTGFFAKDSKGRFVSVDDSMATCFCIEGACMKFHVPTGPLTQLAEEKHGVHLVRVNDDLGYEAVISLLEEACSLQT